MTVLLLLAILAVSVLLTRSTVPDPVPAAEETGGPGEFREDFGSGRLDPSAWSVTRQGDFAESVAEVWDADPLDPVDYRLRLRMNTLGTRDETVKFLGIRNTSRIDLTGDREISFDLDWNNQSNGCYLTGAMYLCPTITDENPEAQSTWLKFEYVGVPPGQNARCIIASKVDGSTRYLFTEGWPLERTGRQLGNQRITVLIRNSSIAFIENGKEIYNNGSSGPAFRSGYLYFQMSSHSNYPSREIYIDNIVVT